MKLLTTLILLAFCTTASALPIKCKYSYQGQYFTGWIDAFEQAESTDKTTVFTVSSAHGFKLDAKPEMPESTGIASLVKKNYAIFTFGADYIGTQAAFIYDQDLTTSYHYHLNRYGIGTENGQRFIYFDIGELLP